LNVFIWYSTQNKLLYAIIYISIWSEFIY
jgi:hypothetical protein